MVVTIFVYCEFFEKAPTILTINPCFITIRFRFDICNIHVILCYLQYDHIVIMYSLTNPKPLFIKALNPKPLQTNLCCNNWPLILPQRFYYGVFLPNWINKVFNIPKNGLRTLLILMNLMNPFGTSNYVPRLSSKLADNLNCFLRKVF